VYGEGGGCALGEGLLLPCASPLYIGVEGAGFLPSKSIGALAKVGGRKSLLSFPHDCYPPFLGILILSLRDMILFLLRGILVRLDQGCGGLAPTTHVHVGPPMQVGPTPEPSRTFPVQYRKIPNIFRWPK
jgi:hypothetical protein